MFIYRQVSNIRRALVSNNIVDHSDVVGASPVGALSVSTVVYVKYIHAEI